MILYEVELSDGDILHLSDLEEANSLFERFYKEDKVEVYKLYFSINNEKDSLENDIFDNVDYIQILYDKSIGLTEFTKAKLLSVNIKYEDLLSDYPNFSITGDIDGTRQKYYGYNSYLIVCGNFIYNLNEDNYKQFLKDKSKY